MQDDKQFGIIHEIGDYSKFKPLSQEDNTAINEQVKDGKYSDNENPNHNQYKNSDKN